MKREGEIYSKNTNAAGTLAVIRSEGQERAARPCSRSEAMAKNAVGILKLTQADFALQGCSSNEMNEGHERGQPKGV